MNYSIDISFDLRKHNFTQIKNTLINLSKKYIEHPDWFQLESIQQNTESIHYENLIKLQKKENMTPKICQILFLSQIPGMSQQIARKILDVFISIKSMIIQLSTDQNPLQTLMNIELETTTGKKRKLGKVLAQRIYTCLFMDSENFL